MSRHPELYQWVQELGSRLDGLSPVVITLLALWSLGIILGKRSSLSSVSCYLAELLDQSDNTLRQRLREFYQEASAKAGAKRGVKRRDWDVTVCFVPLLRWVLSFWSCSRLALALDVTNVGDRWHILCVSVLYGGIGIPVAWKILPGNQKGAWHPHWCALLRRLQPAVPGEWTVIVVGDRGLESAALFRAIAAVGWHPLMRAKAYGKFRPTGWVRWYTLGSLVPRVGTRFTATGLAYKTAQEPLSCTLLACWSAGHDEPWLLLSDLPARAASPCWYAFRAWIEQGFKVIKGGALHWQNTRMTQAARAERLWLALAVTILWMVVIGAVVEGDARQETLGAVETEAAESATRLHRLFQRGLARCLAALIQRRPLPTGKLAPEPWPDTWHDVVTPKEQEFTNGDLYP